MRKFFEEYPDVEFVQQVVAPLPWGHNVFLIELVPIKQDRMFYIKQTIDHGWSRSIMVMQIETALHKLQGQAITNFKDKLPATQSDLAHYTLKDYIMIIRKAEESDEKQLAELFFVTRKATFVSRSHDLIQRNDYLESTAEDDVSVAEADGLIVGFVSTYPKNNFIHNLFVHLNHQKKGVGSTLLAFAENRLSKPMTLKIAMDNLSVCDFYEKNKYYKIYEHINK
jgi:predicted nuclease of restriction endonuclease-like (RecB) superfamily